MHIKHLKLLILTRFGILCRGEKDIQKTVEKFYGYLNLRRHKKPKTIMLSTINQPPC